jgi:hypothetical protein
MKRTRYKICAVYDTETCNVEITSKTYRAYPILFIDNDIRDIDLKFYEIDHDDKVNFYRYENEYINQIENYIDWGESVKAVPIVVAYNLMFDLQPIIYELNKRYDIRANAQSSTNVYTLDLLDKDDGNLKLRFWDTFHLEMGGVKAMGRTCGIAKATGDWDYDKVRTPETPLTDLEYYYAKRDVQVIPAYLRYLLNANEWMKQEDLGVKVLTKTSIVRQMAKRTVGKKKINKLNGKTLTLESAFNMMCKAQLPKTFGLYALRKACFRGGFTFTSARFTCRLMHNVASLDVTSMHHTFINGRYIPLDFTPVTGKQLKPHIEYVLKRTRTQIEENYYKPFDYAFHAVIKFTNVRLKKGTVFNAYGIALEPKAKFCKEVSSRTDIGNDPRNAVQENEIRKEKWFDTYKNAQFALGKLYSAEECTMHFNELELWCFSRVYEFDTYTPIVGETTGSWKIPPDYVTLQSNILFETKNDAKFINNHYKEGQEYPYRMPSTIPTGIAQSILDGTCSHQFFESYYVGTVKGMFNGIYGTMAQDIYKPSYKCEDGNLSIDEKTTTRPDNWKDKQPKQCKVLYTYGMRIVGGSRLHMVLAMEHLYEYFGERAQITGGDTDSMKVAFSEDVTDAEIMKALEPIKICSKRAIDACMKRVRKDYPEHASNLTGVGSFDIESAYGDETRWENHMEFWNKARISESHGHSHVTCAGLSRPEGKYHIENFIDDLLASGYDTEEVFKNAIGFNVCVSNEICHSLEGYKPHARDIFKSSVTDYRGKTTDVYAHESQALYANVRWLGETSKPSNAETVHYLKKRFGTNIVSEMRYLRVLNGMPCIQEFGEYGLENIMEGKRGMEK